jgi:uncharacterized protein DUF5989
MITKPMAKPASSSQLFSHLTTVWAMGSYFTRNGRIFMLPLLLFVLVSGILLVLTGGLSYVAPFVYAVF